MTSTVGRQGDVLLLVVAGCTPGVEKPTPPDLSALVAAYEVPSGTFDAAVVDQVQADLLDALEDEGAVGVGDVLDDLFSPLEGDAPQTSPAAEIEVRDDKTIRIEGEGFLEVARTCDGWGTEPRPDPEHGRLRLNVNVTDVTVDPVLWFEAERCRYLQQEDRVELGAGRRRDVGDVRIFVGDKLTLGELRRAPVLIDVDATASFDGGDTFEDVTFDLRLLPEDATFEVRVEVEDGHLIVRAIDDEIVVVRAANGTFTCANGACENARGDVVNLR
ncbi:MAG: hypothetical protein AAGN82_00310 [Myxococcota bacterium]